jgi:hypothetical protein
MLIELACHFPDPATPWEKIYSLNGKPLSLEKSLAVVRRSPTGFNHGFGGSGPAQLALAVCLELFNQAAAIRLYEDFKWEHIATIGHHGENEAQQEPFTVLLDVRKYADLANE